MRAGLTDVRPLRGVRFNRDRVGSVGPLLAPPYDVAAAPSTGNEFSIAVIENVSLGVAGDQHIVAAARYRDWLERGILRRDDAPAIYLHEHQFAANGEPVTRTAFFAVVRLEDWNERIVLPHERTMPGPRLERGARLRATGANLSPLYFLYSDAGGALRRLISSRLSQTSEPLEFDQVGGGHRLVPVTDPGFHRELSESLRNCGLFVADGHHRYEAALGYRDEMRTVHGRNPDAPYEFVLVMLAEVDDPGVIVLPTHRLLLGQDDVGSRLLEVLGRWFVVAPAVGGAPAANDRRYVSRVMLGGERGDWDVWAREDRAHVALLPRGRGSAFKSLPVAAVEGVVEAVRGAGGRDGVDRLRIVHNIDQEAARQQVRDGEAQAALLLPQPHLGQVMRVSEEGDLLPAKSTWFEPKAPAGLVINDLRSW